MAAAGEPLPTAAVDELRAIVGERHVLTDPDTTAGYVVDWTGRFRGRTDAVVRPGSTAEVAELVRWARRTGQPLVVQGGNTGLVGGAQPLAGEVVVSLTRLAAIEDEDADAGQLTAGAGATIAAVQAAAAALGWRYGVDFGARDSATVGGSVATNAGGLRVLRHGSTRAQVLGVEAVLGTGEVVSHLAGLVKDNTGYDLAQLLCGSEGTLGIVTRARLRLVPPAGDSAAALLAFGSVDEVVAAAGLLRRTVAGLEAAELVLDDGVRLVSERTGAAAPFTTRHAAYLLVEAVGPPDPVDALAAAVATVAGVQDVAVATDAAGRRALWHHREAHTDVINQVGVPAKFDVTIPATRFAAFCGSVPDTVVAVAPGARTWLFGHVGDGNVHVNVTEAGAAADDHRLDDAVLSLVAAHGGSISAEHGIGTAKRAWLHLCRSAAELSAMRAVKRAFDPDGILNPGVLLPPAR